MNTLILSCAVIESSSELWGYQLIFYGNTMRVFLNVGSVNSPVSYTMEWRLLSSSIDVCGVGSKHADPQ